MKCKTAMVCLILAAGDGKRSAIKNLPIYKCNLPLPDGSTPITRLLMAYEKVSSIKAAYIITQEQTPDFEGILDHNWSIPLSIVEDCYGNSYPIVSLQKGLKKIAIPHSYDCVLSSCDYIFDESLYGMCQER